MQVAIEDVRGAVMRWQDGLARARWKPPAVLRAAGRRTLDLVLPPQTLDGRGERAFAAGLSARAWEQVAFIDDPVCDGCGQPFAYALPTRCAACSARPRVFRPRARGLPV